MSLATPPRLLFHELKAPSASGSDRPRVASPVFLVGAERSGTTLLRLMLDHHPGLAFLSDMFQVAADLIGDGPLPDPDSAHDVLACHWGFRSSGLGIDPRLGTADLLDSFLRQARDLSGTATVGAVVHHRFDRLLRVWPAARFIHIVRDARDVGLSTMKRGTGGDILGAVARWIEVEECWGDLCRVVPAGRRLEVRYEDLVADIESGLRRVCEFLGVAYTPAMLGQPEGATPEASSTQAVGKWRRGLTHEEIDLVESRIGAMLTERGYTLSGRGRATPEPIRVDASAWDRLRTRRRRFGLLLGLADVIGRRVPLGPFGRAIRRRIERFEDARTD